MAALGGTSQEISGEAFITGTLKTEGTTMKDFKTNLGGDTAVYSRTASSRDGSFSPGYFPFSTCMTLCAARSISARTVWPTTRRVHPSPSIRESTTRTTFSSTAPHGHNGNGDIDINKETITGTLEVSPLVALDRTIDKIPVLRSILKNKNKGFLYVTYNISGSFDDPDISTNYVERLAQNHLRS
jgi:hypothetical protein